MSMLSITRQNLLSIAVLVMLSVIMLGIGALTFESVKEAQLMRDGEATALRWAKQFHDQPDDTWFTFRQRRPTDFKNMKVWHSSEVGRIVSYELYDNYERLFYSTGAADWQPGESAEQLLSSPITRKHIEGRIPTTRLHNIDSPRGASQYASVVIPFFLGKEFLGTVVAFVDQTEQANSLTYSFSIISTATATLLLGLLGTSVHIVMRRGRERTEAEERVRYLSDHDELTGLPNRHSFNAQLESALEERRQNQRKLAVIFLDINRFKEINDALGHTVGDTVLRGVSERLKANIAGNDFAARLGSNEFAIALTSPTNTADVTNYVEKLSDVLASDYWANGEAVKCAFSMGAAVAPSDGDDPAALARHANLALNRAKSQRAGTFEFFERSMDLAFQRRREREYDLREAVDHGQFHLAFQPQICLDTNAICGEEALLRWEHPVHGTISPAYFIPLAEETELIVPIGEWVLRNACKEAVSWKTPVTVAVNLSPVQFQHGSIADTVARILEETGLNPGRLELEVTENTLMNDTENIVAELTRLRELGVAIAMDDFGTGYSSLSYISSFPFDKIKIDKTFIQAMTRDDALNAIVKCIIAMGHSLGVTITAEGVETEEQAAWLRNYGCHQIQGFLYGVPASAEECRQQIAESVAIDPSKTDGTQATSASVA